MIQYFVVFFLRFDYAHHKLFAQDKFSKPIDFDVGGLWCIGLGLGIAQAGLALRSLLHRFI